MPFETVNEQVYRQRKVKICRRCRRQISETVQNRGTYNTVGSVAGSLGTSMGGSMLMGAVLGPVGAIGGAIGGAIVGSRAGAAATDKACDLAEAAGDDICQACKDDASVRPTGQQNWGGGRLGSTDQPSGRGSFASSVAPATAQSGGEEQGMGARVSEVASVAGEKVSGAAVAAGEGISNGWNWLRTSVSGAVGGSKPADDDAKPSGGKSGGYDSSFQAFGGSGRTLGSAAPAVEPGARRGNPSRLLGGGGAGGAPSAAPAAAAAAPAQASCSPAAPTGRSQEDEDEAFARSLQEQFLREDQSR